MAQVGNSENRFGGENMIQDNDHMREIGKAPAGGVRQPEQSQSRGQNLAGGDQNTGGQQGGERQRKSR